MEIDNCSSRSDLLKRLLTSVDEGEALYVKYTSSSASSGSTVAAPIPNGDRPAEGIVRRNGSVSFARASSSSSPRHQRHAAAGIQHENLTIMLASMKAHDDNCCNVDEADDGEQLAVDRFLHMRREALRRLDEI